MLGAVQSLYVTGTLSMKIDGTVGSPAVQQMGVRQGCPLSPTLFGIFFDGLHDRLQAVAPSAGLQLRSGRWVSSLVYADDVVLLSFTPGGLQQLIDGMHEFCASMGLTISPTWQDRGGCFQSRLPSAPSLVACWCPAAACVSFFQVSWSHLP